MEDSYSENSFSNYGIYTITDVHEFILPGTKIKIEQIGDKAFSYIRKDSQENISEKIIPAKSNEIKQ